MFSYNSNNIKKHDEKILINIIFYLSPSQYVDKKNVIILRTLHYAYLAWDTSTGIVPKTNSSVHLFSIIFQLWCSFSSQLMTVTNDTKIQI